MVSLAIPFTAYPGQPRAMAIVYLVVSWTTLTTIPERGALHACVELWLGNLWLLEEASSVQMGGFYVEYVCMYIFIPTYVLHVILGR